MWYKIAQQGVMNLDRIFQGAEQAITKWLQDQVVLLPSEPGEIKGSYFEFEGLEIPSYLKKFISQIDHNVPQGSNGSYNSRTKILSLPKRVPYNKFNNLLSTVLHEIRHAIDPRTNNSSLMENYSQQYRLPTLMLDKITEYYMSTNTIPSYDEIISKIILDAGGNINNRFVVMDFKKLYSKLVYDLALSSVKKQKNLYLDNPFEHSSQMGDIKALLKKENLDKVIDYIKKNQKENLSDLQIRLLLKNGLNPNNKNFETFSKIIQEASGNEASPLSFIVNNIKDSKWQSQYLKQVNNALSVYDVTGKSLQVFFNQAAQIEALAEKNPRAWNKFINSNFAMRIISNKLYYLFKGLGTGSKSLSQSIKGLNMNSPLWALLEPALEFGLYQFGLFLENPKAFNLETPEQTRIKDLNARINEILADNKITDKRGYFIKNYGSTLKTLGTMERNELLGKLSVMGFGNFMGIGRNIGQK